MNTALVAKVLDRAALARAADGLALLVLLSLPWSTSATSILIVLWLLALAPTLNLEDLRRVLATPAGGLPAALWLLGLIGLAWGYAPVAERLSGFSAFFRLLAIPLLLVQFRRSRTRDAGGGRLPRCMYRAARVLVRFRGSVPASGGRSCWMAFR